MLRQTDPYLRERLHDLDDLANRLLRTLMGKANGVGARELPENAISDRALDGPGRACWTTTARVCAASCWRRAARPATSPSWRALSAFRPSARS